MPVTRVTDRYLELVEGVLASLADENTLVEYEVWFSDAIDQCDEGHEHLQEYVNVFIARHERDDENGCYRLRANWAMDFSEATEEFVINSVHRVWEEMTFQRTAQQMGDLDGHLDSIAEGGGD